MTSPLLSLRAAILSHLADNAGLAGLMGGVLRLYDEPPRGALPVYAVFGEAEATDDSCDGARRHRHALTLTVHGRPGSSRSAIDAAEAMARLLDDAAPALDGHALITLRVQAIATARDERTGETRASLALRAVTEVTTG